MSIQYVESKIVCSHPGLVDTYKASGETMPEPCHMKQCRCAKNQFCTLCGAGRICFPCICDKYEEITPNE